MWHRCPLSWPMSIIKLKFSHSTLICSNAECSVQAHQTPTKYKKKQNKTLCQLWKRLAGPFIPLSWSCLVWKGLSCVFGDFWHSDEQRNEQTNKQPGYPVQACSSPMRKQCVAKMTWSNSTPFQTMKIMTMWWSLYLVKVIRTNCQDDKTIRKYWEWRVKIFGQQAYKNIAKGTTDPGFIALTSNLVW